MERLRQYSNGLTGQQVFTAGDVSNLLYLVAVAIGWGSTAVIRQAGLRQQVITAFKTIDGWLKVDNMVRRSGADLNISRLCEALDRALLDMNALFVDGYSKCGFKALKFFYITWPVVRLAWLLHGRLDRQTTQTFEAANKGLVRFPLEITNARDRPKHMLRNSVEGITNTIALYLETRDPTWLPIKQRASLDTFHVKHPLLQQSAVAVAAHLSPTAIVRMRHELREWAAALAPPLEWATHDPLAGVQVYESITFRRPGMFEPVTVNALARSVITMTNGSMVQLQAVLVVREGALQDAATEGRHTSTTAAAWLAPSSSAASFLQSSRS
jgi:hypothetical protein